MSNINYTIRHVISNIFADSNEIENINLTLLQNYIKQDNYNLSIIEAIKQHIGNLPNSHPAKEWAGEWKNLNLLHLKKLSLLHIKSLNPMYIIHVDGISYNGMEFIVNRDQVSKFTCMHKLSKTNTQTNLTKLDIFMGIFDKCRRIISDQGPNLNLLMETYYCHKGIGHHQMSAPYIVKYIVKLLFERY